MGKEKRKRMGHGRRVSKRSRRMVRIRRKKMRKMEGRKAEWEEKGWDVQYPDLFKKKFLSPEGKR